MDDEHLLGLLIRIESINDFAYINDTLLNQLQQFLHSGMLENENWIFQLDHHRLQKIISEVVLARSFENNPIMSREVNTHDDWYRTTVSD